MSSETKAPQAAPVTGPVPVTPVPEPSATSLDSPASPASPSRRRRGRRPAGADTRAQILASARKLFAERGYDAVSLRAVARDADVDPALVHHYFEGKPAVFTASIMVGSNPVRHFASIAKTPSSEVGSAIVRLFVELWEGADAPSTARGLLQLGVAPEAALRPMREFLVSEVLSRLPGPDGALDPRRAQLIASQLLGLAFSRYILRLPAMTAATSDELVIWLGPTIQRYYDQPLEQLP